MSASDWVIFVSGLLGVLATVSMGIRWMVKSFLMELRPNGGSSMKDSVTKNTLRLERLENRVDDIYRLLLENK
jgi:hypothetical protein